ncbi:hypothetical protein FEM48_Zijuj09G0069800 [Ziziphus jujuba var. spinosa]|uniref:Disease resistance protein At4g27190-like leucine-rich repeats domain-containing protein n=1 Tax=Ziziphus jujuba var. spinosa TaxID=714518 RepID=A0A978URI5_ZIZJJ|nr:hypothetical protein FEM48_Zijuj09G0069800 [Ziziphus jujuba var. spinosa]
MDVSKYNDLEENISKLGEDVEKPINELGLVPELTNLKRGTALFPKLNSLILENLPKFTTLSADASTLALPSLEKLSVSMCPKVETLDYMLNTSSSFQLKFTGFTTTSSVGASVDSSHGLSRLLSCFGSMEINSSEKSIIQQRDELSSKDVLVMSKLVDLLSQKNRELFDLSIRDMDSMLYIWTDQIDDGFYQKLRKMSMFNCPELLNIIPPNMINRMNYLEKIEVSGCQSLETIFLIEPSQLVDFLPILNCLEELVLNDLPKLKHICKNTNIFEGDFKGFHDLKRLDVKECHSLKYLFLSDIAKLLVGLEEVRVTKCNMIEGIIGKSATDDEEDQAQSINEKIKSTKQRGELSGLLMFQKLKNLEIVDCNNLRHVFGGSFGTRGLEQLQTLKIHECRVMKNIVAAVANEENEKEAKATTTMMNNKIVFPQLATLSLWDLPNMERFCQGNNCVMELPSLSYLITPLEFPVDLVSGFDGDLGP